MSAPLWQFWDTIILLGILQGFILSAMLYRSRRQPANRYLSLLIFLITLACVNIYCIDAPWLDAHPVLTGLASYLPLVIVMPMGPLIWLYVRASTDAQFQMTDRYRRHFLTTIIDLLPYCLVLVADIGVATLTVSATQRSYISNLVDQYNVYADIPRWMSTTVYCWMALQYLRRQQTMAGNHPWLRQFLYGFLAFCGIWLLYLIPYAIPATRQSLLETFNWYPIFVPLAILIYWLGMKGYLVGLSGTPRAEEGDKAATPMPRLQDESIERWLPRLTSVMESDKLYLDPELTVAQLAASADLTPKLVSTLLNQHLGKSFSTFVNEYRLAAFRQRVVEQPASNLTISGIAAECGFSSPATFQRIFKQMTGTTPSQYIQQARRSEEQAAQG
ncbi:helix-turn-helix domain-containing protein [Paraflavitalea pollutisoli]|uniref:helix-turn-helix domain-containing protein n=1 Tax=Paraflavitalea pollutisoli TaxID=3034143 RepID=UPI0023EDA93E|nr:helix-turn-helix transcriptional regulator [Paraflavitalea sp. H1-2-19X]